MFTYLFSSSFRKCDLGTERGLSYISVIPGQGSSQGNGRSEPLRMSENKEYRGGDCGLKNTKLGKFPVS